MAFDVDDIAKSTALISAAALDGRKWQDVVDHLQQISGGTRIHISGVDLQTNNDLGIVCAGYDPDWLKSYGEYYGEKNVWMEGIADKETGTPYFIDDLYARDQLERTEFYHDWVRPQGDIVGGSAAMLFNDSSRMFVLGGNLRRRDVEKLGEGWMRLAELVTPHLMNALDVNRLLAGQSLEVYALEKSGGAHRTAVIAVTKDRLILLANPAAEKMLETGQVVRQDWKGRLSFCSAAENLFQRAVFSFSRTNCYLPQTFEIKGDMGAAGYLCRTCAVRADEMHQSWLSILLGREKTALLITIAPRPDATSVAAALAAQYSLSPQECNIAQKIAAGLSLREISDEHQTSLHTVRNQLKSAMMKMGVNKQVDLTRFVEQARLFTL